MKLVHATLRQGKIKVEAPGLFAGADKDNCPPVYPFFGQHPNSYSSVNEGDEVWLLSCTDNKRQLHWFRKDDYEENNAGLLDGKNVEIIMNRESGIGWATLLFEDGMGWIIRNNNSAINITSDGILLDTGAPHRTIDINSGGISLGTAGGSKHKAALGDEVQRTFQAILGTLNSLAIAAESTAFTKHLAPAIRSQIDSISTRIPKITSDNVTLD